MTADVPGEPLDPWCSCAIVIPCYASAECLGELVQRLLQVVKPLVNDLQVILVNDASPDATWDVIRGLAAQHPEVQGFDLLRNGGQYRAILCGLQHADSELIVLMDDDLQHPPEQVPRLLQAIIDHPEMDCVMGKYRVKHHSPLRNLGSRLVGYLDSMLYGKPRDLVGSSFQVMHRRLAEAICAHPTVNPIINPLIYRSTRRIMNVEVEHHQRTHGRSGYTLRQLVRLVVDNVLSASNLPLRLVSILGIVSAMLSLVLAAIYLVAYVTHSIRVPGFATQVLLIIFFGGLSLFSIGLVGEYLIRILEEVRQAPRYVVRQRTDPDRSG